MLHSQSTLLDHAFLKPVWFWVCVCVWGALYIAERERRTQWRIFELYCNEPSADRTWLRDGSVILNKKM